MAISDRLRTTLATFTGAGAAPDLAAIIADKLTRGLGVSLNEAQPKDWMAALALAVRDKIFDRWQASKQASLADGGKQVCYLSIEFLIGRVLRDAVASLGMTAEVEAALGKLGIGSLAELAELEADPALGNGGLGRLAACYLESMASLGIWALGYGIRYEQGLFRQRIQNGQQMEYPDDWLSDGNPWELQRRNRIYPVGFGGVVEHGEQDGKPTALWKPQEVVDAVAYDMPVPGWRSKRVNTLRLWSARAQDPLRLDQFNHGDHIGAQWNATRAASINQVLYPSDASPAGQELRLRQEYFFASASLQDLLKRHVDRHGSVDNLPDKAAVQLNDTHPSIAIAELMRLLMDEHGQGFPEAWTLTRAVINYSNHTLLPEALESWTVHLMQHLLPRHMQILYMLDDLVRGDAIRQAPDDEGFLRSVAIIDKSGDWRVRMGNLAFAGARRVNGVSQLHTDLMKASVFRDMDRLYPGKIVNKTNGVTPRRWLFEINPGLTALVREAAGEGIMTDAGKLVALRKNAEDSAFRARFAAVKRSNKERLAAQIKARQDIAIDPAAMFDVQIKRIHEYKRQLLNLLETVALYQAMRDKPNGDWAPRVKILAGKAAPSYIAAKQIIRLANDVATTINTDPALRGQLKLVFIPNYNVSAAEIIIPAADLSEQISTAGMEASGTGNMKLALNGALTIGTLDGATVEMREHIGAEDVIIFGLTAAQVAARRQSGHDPRANIEMSAALKGALEAIGAGQFSGGDRDRYRSLIDNLYAHDWFMVTADFDAYWHAQRGADALWADDAQWQAKAVRNTAGMGWFSSDRAIRDYARDIWTVPVE